MIKIPYKDFFSNKKYIFIGIVIAICISFIVSILVLIVNIQHKNQFNTIESNDQKLSIQIPKSVKYRINSSKSNEFIIDLFSSEDEMFMYVNSIKKTHELDLLNIVTDDKSSYFEDKENIRDDSGINETNILGNPSFEYNLVYYDKEYKKDFYCDVLWVETNDALYIFNFEVINKNADKYKDIFNKIKSSIVFY